LKTPFFLNRETSINKKTFSIISNQKTYLFMVALLFAASHSSPH
jgi:hypothetical protein